MAPALPDRDRRLRGGVALQHLNRLVGRWKGGDLLGQAVGGVAVRPILQRPPEGGPDLDPGDARRLDAELAAFDR